MTGATWPARVGGAGAVELERVEGFQLAQPREGMCYRCRGAVVQRGSRGLSVEVEEEKEKRGAAGRARGLASAGGTAPPLSFLSSTRARVAED